MISPGPRGQSKLTTGRPWLIASRITSPKPSKRELSANKLACASASPSRRVGPVSTIRPARPSASTCACSDARSGPPPWMRRVQSGWRLAIGAKAAISRSKPFCEVRRPAAAITGASSGERPPGEAGVGFGIRTTRRARRA